MLTNAADTATLCGGGRRCRSIKQPCNLSLPGATNHMQPHPHHQHTGAAPCPATHPLLGDVWVVWQGRSWAGRPHGVGQPLIQSSGMHSCVTIREPLDSLNTRSPGNIRHQDLGAARCPSNGSRRSSSSYDTSHRQYTAPMRSGSSTALSASAAAADPSALGPAAPTDRSHFQLQGHRSAQPFKRTVPSLGEQLPRPHLQHAAAAQLAAGGAPCFQEAEEPGLQQPLRRCKQCLQARGWAHAPCLQALPCTPAQPTPSGAAKGTAPRVGTGSQLEPTCPQLSESATHSSGPKLAASAQFATCLGTDWLSAPGPQPRVLWSIQLACVTATLY